MAQQPTTLVHDPVHAGIKVAVDQQFSQAAAHYVTSPIHAAGPDLAVMVAAAHLTGHERVLDVGCGPGHVAFNFAPHVAHITAVDLSEAMLAQGRRLASDRGITNIEFRKVDAERLPFEDRSFELVTTRLNAHHWPQPETALREFRRVLRPGGRLLLNDIVSFDDYTLDTHFQAIELLRDASHVRDHTIGQWLTMLEEAGFAAELAHTWEVYIDFASWVARMATPAPAVAMIQTILTHAPAEVRAALKVQPDNSFTMQAALFSATTAKG
jgi:ubiquinone/menaquinone biosynthesis C-methylase UbiE